MSIIMFPNNPPGPRGGDTLVAAVPQIIMQSTPQLFRCPDPETTKLVLAAAKAIVDSVQAVEPHINHFVELLTPYRLDGR